MRLRALLTLAALAAPASAQPAGHEDHLRNPDGSWKYTNRLTGSTSPYLLQHAHNPVDWYPWGPEAIERARLEDKPIFLSVGYSTCYWCHVMEREVFSDPQIAALMNESVICVKVDREQRPDLDEIYMMATQLMTRQGGWPNSVFLTPDLGPFFAGTYFGPHDQPGRPGFPTILAAVNEAWTDRRAEVNDIAARAADAIRSALAGRVRDAGHAPLTPALVDQAVAQLALAYDDTLGGFGLAPKFPDDYAYAFLCAVHDRTGDAATLDMALHTLRMMAAGGIHDHVGGGFHRYATDAAWRVPHFEKMLYNQAQLARAYLEAYARTRDESFADAARGIFRFVAATLTGPDGQFYSALDAETDAVEGAYYVWNRAQVEAALAPDALADFDRVFAVADVPEFPGHPHPDGGVLHMTRTAADTAAALGVDHAGLRARVDPILAALARARAPRPLPRLDDKVIAGWNGLMIDACARAARILGDEAYRVQAERAGAFLLDRMRAPDGSLLRTWRDGTPGQPAFHEDYAFVIGGLLSLHRATGEVRWLREAAALAAETERRFRDEQTGGCFFAPASTDLIARSLSPGDGAIPSGNSAYAHALLDLAAQTGDLAWRDRAETVLKAFSGLMAQAPRGYLHMLHAVERLNTGAAPAPSAPEPPAAGPSPVTVTADLDPPRAAPGQTVAVRARLRMDDGWHVNANPASEPFLVATVVEVRGGVEPVKSRYPPPSTLRAGYAQRPLRVYAGHVEIVVTVKVPDAAPEGPLPLRVLVKYQPCDDSTCLAPREVILEKEIDVRNAR